MERALYIVFAEMQSLVKPLLSLCHNKQNGELCF